LEEKSLKLRQLEELIVYTRPDSDISFSEETIKCVMKMIRINLFRPPDLPLTPEEEVFGIADEDENILELIWQNIQPVYQLFLNIVVHKNLDTNQAKRQITLDFIGKFAELFDRDDAREREYVKTLLHRMYGRFLSFRSSIRRLMAHKFFEVVYENRW
jgi:serine/threonine-protein phosphatase 2A regulatory subunit B'